MPISMDISSQGVDNEEAWEAHGEVEAWTNDVMGDAQATSRGGPSPYRDGPKSDLLIASLANLAISYNVVRKGSKALRLC